MNMVTDYLNMFRKRDISLKLFKRIEELAKWAEGRRMAQIGKITERILRFRDSQSVVMDASSTEADATGIEQVRQVAMVVESAIRENKLQWEMERPKIHLHYRPGCCT